MAYSASLAACTMLSSLVLMPVYVVWLLLWSTFISQSSREYPIDHCQSFCNQLQQTWRAPASVCSKFGNMAI